MAVFAERASAVRRVVRGGAGVVRSLGAWGVIVAAGLLACSEKPAELPAPRPAEVVVTPVIPGTAPATPAASTSVPSAASVLGSTPATKPDPTAGRSNKTMSRAEESTAMPMPGQNNDHSAPLPPAKRASSP